MKGDEKGRHSLTWHVGTSMPQGLSSPSTRLKPFGSMGGHPMKKTPHRRPRAPFAFSQSSSVAATVAPSEYPMTPSNGPLRSMTS